MLKVTAPRISLARLPTPLQPLTRFCKKHDLPTIWVKRDDLTDTVGCGNKLRKLEFVVAQALKEGATTLITCGGVQSNHCRATALVASQLGLKCHLILRGRPPESAADGNLLLDQLLGAEITYITTAEYADIDQWFEKIASQYREQGDLPFKIPVGASDEIGLWGYVMAGEELASDFQSQNIQPSHLFSATGSGGTAGGLIIANEVFELGMGVHAFNVCDDEAYFVNKISTDFSLWQQRYEPGVVVTDLPIHIIEGYVGPGYGKAEAPVFDVIKDLARSEGLILDPVYTGKAFHGLVSELKAGNYCDGNDIVFVHTGGIYGLFPQREQLG